MSRLALSVLDSSRQKANRSAASSERWPQWLPEALLLAAGVVVLASYLFLAFTHLWDRQQIDLVSGKLLTFLQGMGLVAVLTWAGCQRQCGLAVALGLVSLVILIEPGLCAPTSNRGDLPAVICQLAAVILVAEQLTRRRLVLAAVLCALAFLASFGAVWGPLAIAWWTFRRQRGLTWLFVSCYLGWTVGSMLLLDSFAEGRRLLNLFGPSASGVRPWSWLDSPLMLLWGIARSGPLPVLLLALCAAGALLAWRQQRLTLYHLALGMSVLNAFGLALGREVTSQQPLVPFVLTIPVLACLWSDLKGSSAGAVAPRPLLALLLLGGMYLGWSTTLLEPMFESVQGLRSGETGKHDPGSTSVEPDWSRCGRSA